MPAEMPVWNTAIASVRRERGVEASSSETTAIRLGASARPTRNSSTPSTTRPSRKGSANIAAASTPTPIWNRRWSGVDQEIAPATSPDSMLPSEKTPSSTPATAL